MAYDGRPGTLGREAAALLPLEPLPGTGGASRTHRISPRRTLRRSLEAVAPHPTRTPGPCLLLEHGGAEALARGGARRLCSARGTGWSRRASTEPDDEVGGVVRSSFIKAASCRPGPRDAEQPPARGRRRPWE